MSRKLSSGSLTILQIVHALQIEGRPISYPNRIMLQEAIERKQCSEADARAGFARRALWHDRSKLGRRVRFNLVPEYLLEAETRQVSEPYAEPSSSQEDTIEQAVADLSARGLIESMPLEPDEVRFGEYKRPDGVTIELLQRNCNSNRSCWLQVIVGDEPRNPLGRPGCPIMQIGLRKGYAVCMGYRITRAGIELLDGNPDGGQTEPKPQVTTERVGTKPNLTRRGRPRTSTADDKAILRSALLAHHKFNSNGPNLEPASLKELAGLTGWDESKTSRILKRLIPGGMSAYKARCKDGAMQGVLTKMEDGTLQPTPMTDD